MITVTTTDHDLGETETRELLPGNYVLVLGEGMDFAREVIHEDGTRVLTLRRRSARSTESTPAR